MGDKTFADEVSDVVSKMVEKDGVWVIPPEVEADLPEPVAYAAKLEKRVRDNSSAFHKANKKALELETINAQLTTHLVENATLHLSNEQRNELEELKLTDPEAWRTKLTEYETQAKQILTEKVKAIATEGKKISELEERKIKLAAFQETTGIVLNDQVIEEQLPASYSKLLAEGSISFDEFLAKAQTFLTKDKVILGAGDEPKKKIDLGKLPGGAEPDAEAQEGDLVTQYNKQVLF